MKKTIYKSASMRSVAIHNLFNRTCIFEAIQDKELNKDRDYIFKDSRYVVHMTGKFLNHCTDYPLLGLIIAKWRNNMANKVESPEFVSVSLDAVKSLIKIAGNATRESEFKKIKESLIRLHSQSFKFKYTHKKQSPFLEGALFKNEPDFDFKNKEIRIKLDSFLGDLYLPNTDITYINFEKLKEMKKEPLMAFYKYLSTHEGVHIDFKLEKLSRIFGLLRRDKNESRCREYIVDKLEKLIILKFIRCYGWDAETNIYRILQSKHFSQNEAEFALKHAKSNFKF